MLKKRERRGMIVCANWTKSKMTHRNTCDQLKLILAQGAQIYYTCPVINACKAKPEIQDEHPSFLSLVQINRIQSFEASYQC